MTYLLWKKSCRGPSTSYTPCVTPPPELYSSTELYSALQRSTALQLYSLYTLQRSTASLWSVGTATATAVYVL